MCWALCGCEDPMMVKTGRIPVPRELTTGRKARKRFKIVWPGLCTEYFRSVEGRSGGAGSGQERVLEVEICKVDP